MFGLHYLYNYPPDDYGFQIDANFGYTAGVHEMLFQSHLGSIDLLPALPSAWKDGAITGVRTIGGHTLDIAWEDGTLKAATITAQRTGDITVRNALFATHVVYVNGRQVAAQGDAATWHAVQGENYTITIGGRLSEMKTVTFDPNGGEGAMAPVAVQAGSAYTLPESSFTRDGYTFSGWLVNHAGALLQAGQTITVDRDIVLAAQWQAKDPVKIPVTGISLQSPSLVMGRGTTLHLSWRIQPANATNQAVTFTTSNRSIATVDENGVVRALGTGTVFVIVTTADGHFSQSVMIRVM